MNIQEAIRYLKEYDGPELRLMEVCGTHTASIFKSGIRSMISEKIRLISGPGCPVCVTPTSYIDRCIDYAMKDNHVLLTFGDMIKVPGTSSSLAEAKGEGARVDIMYSPFEALEKAEKNPGVTYVLAAVGFETTAPIYGLLLREALDRGIANIRLVTALKTVLPALEWICENEKGIDGFICPGHVSVIIGSDAYGELAHRYQRPFAVAGFEPEHILAVLYDLVHQIQMKKPVEDIHNLYPNAVRAEGNPKAAEVLYQYFEEGPALWRGLGVIPGSGLYLKDEFAAFEGGSRGLETDRELPPECRCGEVIVGRIDPDQCPMFDTGCTPTNPYGPCMVSAEGACGIWYRNR